MFKAERLWRFYPGKIYPGIISYFDKAGFLTGYRTMVLEGIMPDLSLEEIRKLDPGVLPDDIMIDRRSLKQIRNKCCPPQIYTYEFEGIEMI